jgi:hypothetical protein
MPTTHVKPSSGARNPTARTSPATSASTLRRCCSAPSRTVTTRKIAAAAGGATTFCIWGTFCI